MGSRGTKPKPTALRVLSGARPCRVNAAEPRLEPGRPDPPQHLDALGREEWARITAVIESLGVLTAADGAALGIYCVAYSRWRAALAKIEEHGLYLDTTTYLDAQGNRQPNPKGCIKPNPAVAIATSCEATMGRILGAFGLTPSDRTRVQAIDGSARSSIDRLARFAPPSSSKSRSSR